MTKQKHMVEQPEDTNVLPFAVPTPKVDGQGPIDTNWLLKLRTGTMFLVRPKSFTGFNLHEFTHGGRKGSSVLLIEDTTVNAKFTWVDPVRFCKLFDLVDIIEEPET